jgi:hypothetical protein
VVQPATGIGGHPQAGVLQSFHHLLGGPGAAAGRDLDLVELRIESSGVADRLQPVVPHSLG